MKSKLERYVKNIVSQTECSKEDQEDLYEELLIHLQLSRDHFLEQGFSFIDAEKKAMAAFGEESEIGSYLQQSMFPFRKEMMLTLGISSIFFTISLYLCQLFIEGDAHIAWLLFSIVTSSFFVFIPLYHGVGINRKKWINTLLILQILTGLYGWGLSSDLNSAIATGTTLWNWLNIALSLGLVYRTTIYDFNPNLGSFIKIMHGVNITIGIMIIGFSIFIIGSGVLLVGFHPLMFVYGSPLIIWVISYIVQMKLAFVSKKATLILCVIPVVVFLCIIMSIFYLP